MRDGDFWSAAMDKYSSDAHAGRVSSVKIALLFASAAVASALLLTPILAVDDKLNPSSSIAFGPNQYDDIVTGSIPDRGRSKTYTIRRSILQEFPGSVCIIQMDGTESGDCGE